MGNIKYCALTTLAGSIRSFVLPAAKYLAENGYDVTVGCKRDEQLEETLRRSEVGYLPLDIERGFSLKGTLKGIWQLFWFFRKNKVQMVEYGTENVAFCASIASRLACVPVRIYNHWGARYVGYPKGVGRRFSIFVEKTTAKLSTVVRQVSEENRRMCVADGLYPEKKVKVLGYGGTVGADFSRFDISRRQEYNEAFRKKHGIPMDAIVYGDICAIRKDKGSNELIEAFRKIGKPDAWLVFVGKVFPPDAPQADLMHWAQNSDRVIFTGMVPDVEHYVAAFDILVHPSYREGLGMVLQEAGAMGVPCITTNIPGPREFGMPGTTGMLVQKADVDDLYEKMMLFYNDRPLLKKYSEAVYTMTKERYEREVMVERIRTDRDELKEKYIGNKL